MRKVTASAVLLTAITGCSQGAPSTQWSFEVPATEATNDSQANVEAGAKEGSENLSVATFAGESFEEGMMGPAFEQPEQSAPKGARISTIGRPGSKERSSISVQALNRANGTPTRSSRPDPVAQVRSYLRASASPSALVNRQPYSSDVYLSTLPAPKPSELGLAANAIPSVESATSAASASGSTGFTSSSFVEPTFPSLDFGSPASPGSDASTVATSTPSNNLQTFLSSSIPADTMPASGLTTSNVDTSLPALADFPVASDTVATPAFTPVGEMPAATVTADAGSIVASGFGPSDESVPIGTAILRDLQQSGGVEPVPASADIPVSVAYQPASIPAGGSPTLASLTSTMDRREVSPLVESFRSYDYAPGFSGDAVLPAGLSPEGFEVAPVSTMEADPAGSTAVEAIFESVPQQPSDLGYEVDLHSSNSGDFQPEDFLNQDVPPVYAPLAVSEAFDLDMSATIVGHAVAALSDEVAATDVMADVDFASSFPSLSAELAPASDRANSLLKSLAASSTQPAVSLDRLLSGLNSLPAQAEAVIPELLNSPEEDTLSMASPIKRFTLDSLKPESLGIPSELPMLVK